MANLLRQLAHYRLTTAEIIYHMPDHPALLQSYVWQELDRAPDFPELHKFLHFWADHLDGKLHVVKVMHQDKISAGEWCYHEDEIRLHS